MIAIYQIVLPLASLVLLCLAITAVICLGDFPTFESANQLAREQSIQSIGSINSEISPREFVEEASIRIVELSNQTHPALRCSGTKGDWCKEYFAQVEVEWRVPPRGDKDCPSNCYSHGNCNHGSGLCECTAGWSGDDCSKVQKRPCTSLLRDSLSTSDIPLSSMDEEGRDSNWFQHSSQMGRCSGVCDDDLAMCYCHGKYGRVNAPAGSPLGTPPLKLGRPMATPHCQPRWSQDGRETNFGGERKYDDLFGPKGWCEAEAPTFLCPCVIDGLAGRMCEEQIEHFCVNQCSGHGVCNLGFCVCDPGWYGHDCSLKRAGLPLEPSRIPQHAWLNKIVAEPQAAMIPPPAATRKLPLIYIYDLEPLYSSRMLQYRIPSSWCVHRRYDSGNTSMFMDMWVYAVDTLFHELLAQSEHRTFDPEEADFFYVPHTATCYAYPVMGWADYPWFPEPGSDQRPMHMANMILETKQWIDKKFPFWKRRGGADHIWPFTHDEGACWAPNDVVPSIWLTHWGRMDLDHTSNSAFLPDNYTMDTKSPRQPNGWRHKIAGHACYNPVKDLVVPSFKAPSHYHESPLLGQPPRQRDILLFFKGNVGKHRLAHYSRGIRQRIHNLSIQNGWRKKHNVQVGAMEDVAEDYSKGLSRAKFALVAPGDGWSGRAEDAMIHGAIPVVIMDNVHAVFESVLDWNSFSVRISEADIDKIVDVLLAIPERNVISMQRNVARTWHRFRWASGPALLRETLYHQDKNKHKVQDAGSALGHVKNPPPFKGDPSTDDAFSTIIQWLHSRIPATRRAPI
eukprot:gene23547-9071_t